MILHFTEPQKIRQVDRVVNEYSSTVELVVHTYDGRQYDSTKMTHLFYLGLINITPAVDVARLFSNQHFIADF